MKAFDNEEREAVAPKRRTRRPTNEWGENRRDEAAALYRLLSSGDAVCANDVIPDRWTDSKSSALSVLCDRCPLKQPCLQYALEHDVIGVWGGTSHAQRKHMRRVAPEPVGFTPYLVQTTRVR